MAKKPVQTDATAKTWVKIVCGIMGFLMVFGILVMVISSLQSAALESNIAPLAEDQMISVGLYCNENAVQSYTLNAQQGFDVISFSGLKAHLNTNRVIVATDANLYRIGDTLYTESIGVPAAGGYHIEISYFAFTDIGIDTDHDNPVFIRPGNTAGTTDGYRPSNVQDYIALLQTDSTFQAMKLPAFPYYYSADKCYIRVGSFFSQAEAEDALSQLGRTATLSAKIVGPSADTVSILAADYSILCELESKGKPFSITASEDEVLTDAEDRLFFGEIQLTGKNKRLSVINRLSVELYVAALLASEIPSGWNAELLKTMAVILRTELSGKLGCHAKDGYDVCGENHCHPYIGGAIADKAILTAVSETAGQILTYDNRPIYTPYSMTNGSGTVSSKEAFGKELAYLQAIYTPWETSEDWNIEFSPFELYQLLKEGGYTEIVSNIAEVKILSFSEGSDYVNSIRFTDLFGNSVTLNGSELIRMFFAGRLPSACFVVGKAGESIQRATRSIAENGSLTQQYETVTLNGTYGSFVFCGRGSGSGVGLSIMGAKALAEQKIDYIEILSRYFPGAVLIGTKEE